MWDRQNLSPCINFDLRSLHSSQVLFGQMMTLPAPRLHPMAFCTLMVELCKVCVGGEPLLGGTPH